MAAFIFAFRQLPLADVHAVAAAAPLIATALAAVFLKERVDASGWALVAGGGMGALAHLLLVRALAAAPASELQPYNYFLLVFATMLGALVYGDLPGVWTWIGAAIVVLCGILATRRREPGGR